MKPPIPELDDEDEEEDLMSDFFNSLEKTANLPYKAPTMQNLGELLEELDERPLTTCPECNGKGRIMGTEQDPSQSGGYREIMKDCEHCDGYGQIEVPEPNYSIF